MVSLGNNLEEILNILFLIVYLPCLEKFIKIFLISKDFAVCEMIVEAFWLNNCLQIISIAVLHLYS